MPSDSPVTSQLVAADDPTVQTLMNSYEQASPRIADLSMNLEFEVVRVLYLGNDIDGQLRAEGFPVQVIPFVVSLGYSLYDLAVAKVERERFHALLKPALTTDNEEKNFHDFVRHERLTKNDLLVQRYGKAQAARMTLDEFDKHSLSCWENARPWLEGEINTLRADLRRQGLDILSSAVRKKLDDDYLSFHDEYGQYISEAELSMDLSRLRQQPSRFALGDWDPVEVGDIKVIPIEHEGIEITVFLPEQSLRGEKRPGMEWFHGGGFIQGGSTSEKSSLTRWCRELGCVIFSVEYRLSPENPFPAPVKDAIAALKWVRTRGVELFNVDMNRIAVGGVSSGANLAAVTALKDAQANASPPLVFQLLIVPLLCNAATSESIGRQAGGPGLFQERLLYFQRCYLPRPEDRNCWEASPICISLKNLRDWPLARAYIAVAEMDPLCYEGLKYARMLARVGKAPTVNTVERASHQVMGLAGVTKKSRELHLQLISYMAKQFGETLGGQP